MATKENIGKYAFAIVEFLEDQSAEVVPCNWVLIDDVTQKFKCQWPGSHNTLKYSQSKKNPTTSWSIHICIPRKFFGKLIFHKYNSFNLKEYACINIDK